MVRVVVATEREREAIDGDPIELSRVAIRLLDLADQGAVHRVQPPSPEGARGAAVRSAPRPVMAVASVHPKGTPAEADVTPARRPRSAQGASVPSRPKSSSSRMTSSSSGVETSISSSARWPRSGGSGRSGPADGRPARAPRAARRRRRPRGRAAAGPSHDEDRFVLDLVPLERQRWPVSMTRTFPTYRSVWAQMSSWPHGFSTRRPVTSVTPRTSRSPAASIASRVSAGRRLGVDADERLGAGRRTRSHEPSARKNLKPSLVSSARSVRRVAPASPLGGALAQVDEQAALDLRVRGAVDVDVDAPIERRAGELVEGRPRATPASAQPLLAQEQVEQQQVGVDPVALGEVHPEPEAARLLGAHHRAGLDHLRADELEPDRRLVRGDPVALAEAGRHRGVVDRRRPDRASRGARRGSTSAGR